MVLRTNVRNISWLKYFYPNKHLPALTNYSCHPRGRFGVIRECRENATGNLFMAKIVPYEADSKQEVLQEYDILKSLHHERIMALHEAYVTPRYLVLIAEYCSGKELLFSLVDR